MTLTFTPTNFIFCILYLHQTKRVAQLNKTNKINATKYFRKAIENSFNNFSHIKQDKDLDFIRNEKEFNEILKKIQ